MSERTHTTQSPVIYRCGHCAGLVHLSDASQRAAWCRRCGRIVPVHEDGGGR